MILIACPQGWSDIIWTGTEAAPTLPRLPIQLAVLTPRDQWEPWHWRCNIYLNQKRYIETFTLKMGWYGLHVINQRWPWWRMWVGTKTWQANILTSLPSIATLDGTAIQGMFCTIYNPLSKSFQPNEEILGHGYASVTSATLWCVTCLHFTETQSELRDPECYIGATLGHCALSENANKYQS